MSKITRKERKNRILFIDDNKGLLGLYSLYFNNNGFDISVCSDSKSIIAQTCAFKPDLIFLDLVMNNQDGLVVLKELKSTLQTKWIPVVMFTNIDNSRDKELCLKNGVSDYLVKVNFTPKELAEYASGVLK